MNKKEILETISWYIECKETVYKIERLYRQFLDIGYDDPGYFELKTNYNKAYKELRNTIKKEDENV